MAKNTSPRHPKNGSVAPMPPASNTGFEHLSVLPKGSSVEPEPRRSGLSEPSRKGGAAAAKAEPSQKGGAAAPRRSSTEAAAKAEPSQAQSAIAARMAQQPTIAVRGSCSSPAAGSGGAGPQAAPQQPWPEP